MSDLSWGVPQMGPLMWVVFPFVLFLLMLVMMSTLVEEGLSVDYVNGVEMIGESTLTW